MKIRRQVYELTTEDFQVNPVWEFASDDKTRRQSVLVHQAPLPMPPTERW